MIVSHRYKFVFASVPKAGSSAVETFFNSPAVKGTADLVNEDLYPQNKHLPYTQILDLVPSARGYFSFAVVRHPRAIVVSQYKMWKERLFPYAPQHMSFDNWVLNHDYLLVPKFTHIVKGVGSLYKYEDMHKHWSKIFEKLGIDATYKDLLRPNASVDKTPWQKFYTNNNVGARVDNLFADELRIWRSL